jgi:hypothetical protein
MEPTPPRIDLNDMQRGIFHHLRGNRICVVQAPPNSGKTTVSALLALRSVDGGATSTSTPRTRAIVVCSTKEQCARTTRAIGHVAEVTGGAGGTAVADVLVECAVSAWRHIHVGCTPAVVVFNDMDSIASACNNDNSPSMLEWLLMIPHTTKICCMATVFAKGTLRLLAKAFGDQAIARPSTVGIAHALYQAPVTHYSVMVENKWKVDTLLGAFDILANRGCHRLVVCCGYCGCVDTLASEVGHLTPTHGYTVFPVHGRRADRFANGAAFSAAGAGARVVLISTECIINDTATVAPVDALIFFNSLRDTSMVRVVCKVKTGGVVIHFLTRDDVITFQRTAVAHGIEHTDLSDL